MCFVEKNPRSQMVVCFHLHVVNHGVKGEHTRKQLFGDFGTFLSNKRNHLFGANVTERDLEHVRPVVVNLNNIPGFRGCAECPEIHESVADKDLLTQVTHLLECLLKPPLGDEWVTLCSCDERGTDRPIAPCQPPSASFVCVHCLHRQTRCLG